MKKFNGSKNFNGILIRWITYACFEIKLPEGTIVIDPYIGASKATPFDASIIEGADCILVSHTHYDHVTDIKYLVDKFNSQVYIGAISSLELLRYLDCQASNVMPVTPGYTFYECGGEILPLRGRHLPANINISAHVKRIIETQGMQELELLQWYGGLDYINYFITTSEGIKILFFGNSCTRKDLMRLKEVKPDIALVQMSKFGEGREEMFAEFCSSIGAKVIIPHHMDMRYSPEEYGDRIGIVAEILKEKSPEILLINPESGRWYRFGHYFNTF